MMTQLANPLLPKARIPYGLWSRSRLLHLPCRFLLVAWKRNRGWIKALELCICMSDPEKNPALDLLSSNIYSHLGNDPEHGKSLSFFLVSVNLPFQ